MKDISFYMGLELLFLMWVFKGDAFQFFYVIIVDAKAEIGTT